MNLCLPLLLVSYFVLGGETALANIRKQSSVSTFAADCSSEINHFNQSMNELRRLEDQGVSYIDRVANYLQENGNFIASTPGRRIDTDELSGRMIRSADAAKSDADTLSSNLSTARNDVIESVQGIINCKSE